MILAVRIRGTVGVNKDIADTMDMLRLTRINHAVLINENQSYKGMLLKAKDYITWGEIDLETLTLLIDRRGRVVGGDRITDEYIQETLHKCSVVEG